MLASYWGAGAAEMRRLRGKMVMARERSMMWKCRGGGLGKAEYDMRVKVEKERKREGKDLVL